MNQNEFLAALVELRDLLGGMIKYYQVWDVPPYKPVQTRLCADCGYEVGSGTPGCATCAAESRQSSEFSEFIRNASPEEKERVYAKVMDEANAAQ